MATALSNGLPLTGADGSSGRNNGRDIRKGLLSSLLLPDTKANPLAVRNGVLSHDYDSAGVKSLRVDQTGTASNQVIIQPGAFVSERAGQGPYIGWLETSAGVLLTPPGSDSTNPRWDVVFAQVLDKASISLDPSTDAIVDVVTGVPSATPQVPAVTADGAVILAQLYRPAGNSTIPAANITDKRRSSGLVGTVRRLLPGDFLSDAGKVDGELRYRQAVGGLPSLVDYWDARQSLWRGTQSFTLTANFPGTPDAGGIVYGNTRTGETIVSLNIPDPGFPYRVQTSAYLTGIPTVPGVGPGPNGSCNVYISVNYGPFSSNLITSSEVYYNSTSQRRPFQLQPQGAAIFTGPSTVRLITDQYAGGADNFSWQTDQRNPLTCRADPA